MLFRSLRETALDQLFPISGDPGRQHPVQLAVRQGTPSAMACRVISTAGSSFPATMASYRGFSLSSSRSVSYTHLDVYKRQDEWGTWWDEEPGTIKGHLYQQNTLRDAFAVSYTHLDVYKRQPVIPIAEVCFHTIIFQANL